MQNEQTFAHLPYIWQVESKRLPDKKQKFARASISFSKSFFLVLNSKRRTEMVEFDVFFENGLGMAPDFPSV